MLGVQGAICLLAIIKDDKQKEITNFLPQALQNAHSEVTVIHTMQNQATVSMDPVFIAQIAKNQEAWMRVIDENKVEAEKQRQADALRHMNDKQDIEARYLKSLIAFREEQRAKDASTINSHREIDRLAFVPLERRLLYPV